LLYYFYNAGGKKMFDNVFMNKKGEEHIKLSNGRIIFPDGRIMTFGEIIDDYERLLEEDSTYKEQRAKDQMVCIGGQRVGELFLIDREVIEKNRSKIRNECQGAGAIGRLYWKRFEQSNRIANEKSKYTTKIKTYVFRCYPYYGNITQQGMRDLCSQVGDGMCDEVICDLELQMKICNGVSAYTLFEEPDRLPQRRIIELLDGGTGLFGGETPANIERRKFFPNSTFWWCYAPYAYRCVKEST